MNYLLEPAIRWMNRLKYGYKFTLIGFLIFLQAAVLIYLLVAELNRNIDLAEKERMGIQYEVSLTDLLETAQEYRTLHYDYLQNPSGNKQALLDQQTKVDQALDAWEALERQTGDQLDTGWKTQWVRQEWLKRKDGVLETPAGQEQVAFDLDSRWLDEIVDLMQHVGYSSNLAMDSDFDTSYLVDSVLRKMPELADNLTRAVALADELQNPTLSADRKSRLLQIVGLERSALDQIGHNSQLVFRHNEQVRNKLNKIHGVLADSVPIFAWNIEQKVVGQQGLPIPQELLASTGKQAIQNTMAVQRGDLQVIDELLLARIDQYGQHRNGVLLFSGAILLLLCYLFIGLDLSVRRAVYQLVGVMHRVRKGDWAVRGTVLSQDEMGSLTTSINTTLDSLQKMYEEVQRSHACIEAWNQELEQKIAERTASLRSLLDHAGQGFLSFGSDLTVSNEYSAECRTIFERPIGGESVAKLLYPDNEAEQNFLAELFAKLFMEQKRMMRETYLSLLPEEIQIGDRSIGISYKLLSSKPPLIEEKIMMVLTDLTLQKSLENQMQEERDVLSMVVHVVTHSDDFFTTVNQYIDFCREGMEKRLQETRPAAEILAVLFRTVHTFKGSFGQLRMNHLMEKLHGLEEKLGKVRSLQGSSLTIEKLREALQDFKPAVLLKWLEEDREILKETLGDGFFEQENRIVIDSERLLELEAKVQEVLPPDECRILLPELRRLRYKSLKELLESYPEYTVALAERNEKAVALFDIDGGETMVDPLAYQDFVKSLGHVFRNAVVHGLESMEERLKAGKSETGRIRCRIEDEAAGMRIRISDDGRGMEPEKIGRLALHKGICTEEELAAMNEQQRLQLVFADGFSGAKQVNELAGRGVGLSAVLAEIKKLGGSVQIQSTPGTGTEFIFFLPFTAADHCAA